MRVTKILLPVDGSGHASKAAEYAADLAVMAKAEIVLLYCRKTVPAFLGDPNAQEYLDKLLTDAETILAPYRESLKNAEADFTDLVVGGPTAEVVANVAEAEGCDLIVMGSKGKSDLEGLLLGSVTHRVLHVAPCPVLVIR